MARDFDEVFSTLKDGASAVVREAETVVKKAGEVAKEAGTVVGIGVGTMTIELERHEFRLGDTVRGTLKLELAEPIDAEKLVVGVLAKQWVHTGGLHLTGKVKLHNRKRKAHRSTKRLGHRRTYDSDTFEFELDLPSEVKANPVESFIDDINHLQNIIGEQSFGDLEWVVFGYLAIPWKVNLKDSVEIDVSD